LSRYVYPFPFLASDLPETVLVHRINCRRPHSTPFGRLPRPKPFFPPFFSLLSGSGLYRARAKALMVQHFPHLPGPASLPPCDDLTLLVSAVGERLLPSDLCRCPVLFSIFAFMLTPPDYVGVHPPPVLKLLPLDFPAAAAFPPPPPDR